MFFAKRIQVSDIKLKKELARWIKRIPREGDLIFSEDDKLAGLKKTYQCVIDSIQLFRNRKKILSFKPSFQDLVSLGSNKTWILGSLEKYCKGLYRKWCKDLAEDAREYYDREKRLNEDPGHNMRLALAVSQGEYTGTIENPYDYDFPCPEGFTSARYEPIYAHALAVSLVGTLALRKQLDIPLANVNSVYKLATVALISLPDADLYRSSYDLVDILKKANAIADQTCNLDIQFAIFTKMDDRDMPLTPYDMLNRLYSDYPAAFTLLNYVVDLQQVSLPFFSPDNQERQCYCLPTAKNIFHALFRVIMNIEKHSINTQRLYPIFWELQQISYDAYTEATLPMMMGQYPLCPVKKPQQDAPVQKGFRVDELE